MAAGELAFCTYPTTTFETGSRGVNLTAYRGLTLGIFALREATSIPSVAFKLSPPFVRRR